MMKIDRYLLFDGAIGTYYATKNRPYNLIQANIFDYNTIVSIHREYINSGAMAISTNTFCNDNFTSIKAAIAAAKDAVRKSDIHIFASIGPLNDFTIEDYKPIIDLFIDNGITNFIFETFANVDIAIPLADYIKKKLNDSFILLSCAVDQSGYTSHGIYYTYILEQIKASSSIDSYGFNCISGPVHMKALAAKLDNNDLLSIMPNAGYPSFINGAAHYTDNPEYFAEQMLNIHNLGIKILGGCCGTTPNHIKYLKELLEKGHIIPTIKSPVSYEDSNIAARENILSLKLSSQDKVIIVEYDPPLSATGQSVTDAAILIEKAGADAISIADNPLGRARADSLIIASRIKRDTNKIAVIPHITCRDRNSISIRSALMALNVEDINNILCITGDPVPTYYDKQAKGVFSFHSISLLKYVRSINDELNNVDFLCGAALNINANKFDLELNRAVKKIESGAKYFITQPCFTQESIDNIAKAYQTLNIPIIAGLMPIKSYRNAIFINNEISGIDIPQEMVDLYKDKTPEECNIISRQTTLGLVERLNDSVKGYHLITPPKGEHIITQIIKEIKSR